MQLESRHRDRAFRPTDDPAGRSTRRPSAIAALAARDVQLVVYHTAVLGYVPSRADRDAFVKTVGQIGAVWISNEVPSVLPALAKGAPPPASRGDFLLTVDGKPVAWTVPHGQSINWLAG
jgi:hypothetical protein